MGAYARKTFFIIQKGRALYEIWKKKSGVFVIYRSIILYRL